MSGQRTPLFWYMKRANTELVGLKTSEEKSRLTLNFELGRTGNEGGTQSSPVFGQISP